MIFLNIGGKLDKLRIITIIENHKPGYVCEANGLTSNVFDNSSAAINMHYWQLFSSQTKYSGPLIMTTPL